jgi:hypothetical protein
MVLDAPYVTSKTMDSYYTTVHIIIKGNVFILS